jgi:hypothetical protein
MTKIDFPGFPGLDFGILKFHDFPGFPGPVRTLFKVTVERKNLPEFDDVFCFYFPQKKVSLLLHYIKVILLACPLTRNKHNYNT